MKVSVKMSKRLREAGIPAQALAERLPGCKVFGSRVEWDDGEPEPADPGHYLGEYGTLECLADYLRTYRKDAPDLPPSVRECLDATLALPEMREAVVALLRYREAERREEAVRSRAEARLRDVLESMEP